MISLFEIFNTINNNNIYGGECKRIKTTSNNNKKSISIIPELDVTLTNEQLLIQVELPGVNKHDIEIDINDSILTIQGEKKKSNNGITTNSQPQERTFGYFKRNLDLTKLINQLNLNSINTTFENGILSITIDKKENHLNLIKIQIN